MQIQGCHNEGNVVVDFYVKIGNCNFGRKNEKSYLRIFKEGHLEVLSSSKTSSMEVFLM